jgi:hypothetical protein
MTEQEKELMLDLAKAVEYLYAENVALKVTLEHHHVSPSEYEAECKDLIEDPKLSALAHRKFLSLFDEIEQAPNLSKALEQFARRISESSTKH